MTRVFQVMAAVIIIFIVEQWPEGTEADCTEAVIFHLLCNFSFSRRGVRGDLIKGNFIALF